MTRRLLAVLGCFSAVLAQTPMTYQYAYDDLGQLTKVIDSTGIVIEYVYDAVGNMVEIKRSAIQPGALTIFSFTPQSASPLATVTLRGQGFSPTVGGNLVFFGEIQGTVLAASTSELIVQIPGNAQSGLISVTVNGTTVTSGVSFSVTPTPAVLSISPKGGAPGSTVPALQVTGVNLSGATFSFNSTGPSPAPTVGPAAVNSQGTLATMPITIGGSVSGVFVLVATSAMGTSDRFASEKNTFKVALPTEFIGSPVSMLNQMPPNLPGTFSQDVGSYLISFLNTISPESSQPVAREAATQLVSILNGTNPSSGSSQRETGGALVSVLNQAVAAMLSSTGQVGYESAIDPSAYGPDTDGDGIPDSLEALIFTNSGEADTDGDGIPDGLEIVLGGDPRDPGKRPRLYGPPEFAGVMVSIRNLGLRATESFN